MILNEKGTKKFRIGLKKISILHKNEKNFAL